MFPDNIHWTRDILNFIAYHIILLIFNYTNDKVRLPIHCFRLVKPECRFQHERVQYTIWDDLKNRYAEAQAAQTTERHYADSKRRLTSLVNDIVQSSSI